MELETVMQSLANQGPTYWVAAAAIALGATLLITAAVLQWRRVRSSRPAPARRRRPATVPVHQRTAVADYAAQTASNPPAAPSTPDPALAGRLAAAADRLTAIRADLARWEHLPDVSDLKAPASHVEYVFRSGEA